jgi:hypothetical protein
MVLFFDALDHTKGQYLNTELVGCLPFQSPGKGWENNLRKGFLHGVKLLIDILSWMQGMDLQVRQVNQHVEFEFEWESAFNLHMRLAPIFSLVLVKILTHNFEMEIVKSGRLYFLGQFYTTIQ